MPNQGATSTFASPSQADPQNQRPAAEQRLRVLVIDDSRPVAEITRLILEDEGHEAAVAYDGTRGLELAREFRPQAVLCDINLAGGMDGYSVARAFRSDPTFSRAILVAATAHCREEIEGTAVAAGFDLVLTKPIDLRLLRPMLDQMPPKESEPSAC